MDRAAVDAVVADGVPVGLADAVADRVPVDLGQVVLDAAWSEEDGVRQARVVVGIGKLESAVGNRRPTRRRSLSTK
jgi:hypothetical protein